MTNDELKSMMIEKLNEVRAKKNGVSTERNYQLGIISGMVKAFVMSGLIDKTDAKAILEEILEEEF